MGSFFQWISNIFRSAKWWTIVLPWERAVRVRLGKRMVLWDPGFHWRLPFFDDVTIFNNRLRITPFPTLTVTSKDRRTITAAGAVGFRMIDPLAAMCALSQPAMTCAALAQADLAALISESGDPGERLAASLEARTLEALKKKVPGIAFDFVRLIDIAEIRTFRILHEEWRPGTKADSHE